MGNAGSVCRCFRGVTKAVTYRETAAPELPPGAFSGTWTPGDTDSGYTLTPGEAGRVREEFERGYSG